MGKTNLGLDRRKQGFAYLNKLCLYNQFIIGIHIIAISRLTKTCKCTLSNDSDSKL